MVRRCRRLGYIATILFPLTSQLGKADCLCDCSKANDAPPPFSKEDQEAFNFDKSLNDSAVNGLRDVAWDEATKTLLDIPDSALQSSVLIGPVVDFLQFNANVGSAIDTMYHGGQMTPQQGQQIAESAVSFGLSTTTGAFVAGLAATGTLPALPALAAGVAVGVGTSYLVRVVIIGKAPKVVLKSQ